MRLSVILFAALTLSARAQVWTITPTWETTRAKDAEPIAYQWRATVNHGLAGRLTGNSMRPYIEPGDLLLWEPRFGKLKGRVLLISNGGDRLPTAHYCYDEDRTHVFMVGLNNRVSDGWIAKDRATHALVTVVKTP